jgi:1-acyl-sn-glycerol-3-phosphate acyltransferase
MNLDTIRDTKILRRLVTIPVIVLAFFIIIPAMVLIAPLSVIFDLVRGRPRLPTIRVALFGCFYLVWDVIASISAVVLWVASGFGLLLGTRAFIQTHRRIQVSWANSLIGAMRVLIGLRLEIEGADCVASGGPVVVFCRHASIVDTLLPAHILSTYGGLDLRYVLKHELLWDPALDLVGNRIPNHFVDRSGTDTAAELARIGKLASGMDDNESFTIFPEGSRYTEAKRARALEKLAESSPQLLERAQALTRTMPPRPGGVLTVLSAAEGADVVIIAHTGLEGLNGPVDLWKAAPIRHPVRIKVWRIPASEVPAGDAERMDWIFAVWADVNDWIVAHLSLDP